VVDIRKMSMVSWSNWLGFGCWLDQLSRVEWQMSNWAGTGAERFRLAWRDILDGRMGDPLMQAFGIEAEGGLWIIIVYETPV